MCLNDQPIICNVHSQNIHQNEDKVIIIIHILQLYHLFSHGFQNSIAAISDAWLGYASSNLKILSGRYDEIIFLVILATYSCDGILWVLFSIDDY